MALSAEQRDFYRENGYLVIERLLGRMERHGGDLDAVVAEVRSTFPAARAVTFSHVGAAVAAAPPTRSEPAVAVAPVQPLPAPETPAPVAPALARTCSSARSAPRCRPAGTSRRPRRFRPAGRSWRWRP